MLLTFNKNTESSPAPLIPDKTIKLSLSRRLQSNFPNQTINFYSNVLSCYEHSIENKLDPSIIMLVSDKLTSKNVNCVSKKLLKLLAQNFDDKIDYDLLVLNSDKYKNKKSEAVKMEMDEDLVEIFSKENFALVEDIHNLPAKSMILFYTYGDDASTAKFKGIMIFFTYELDVVISNNKEKIDEFSKDYSKLSSFIEKNLNDKWSKDIDYDQLKPLFTRIGNNYVLVNPEQSCE